MKMTKLNLGEVVLDKMRQKGGPTLKEEIEYGSPEEEFHLPAGGTHVSQRSSQVGSSQKEPEQSVDTELVGYSTVSYYATPMAALVLRLNHNIEYMNRIPVGTMENILQKGGLSEIDLEDGKNLLTVIAVKSEIEKLYQASIEGKLAGQKLVPIGQPAEQVPFSMLTPEEREMLGLLEMPHKAEVGEGRHIYEHRATNLNRI